MQWFIDEVKATMPMRKGSEAGQKLMVAIEKKMKGSVHWGKASHDEMQFDYERLLKVL